MGVDLGKIATSAIEAALEDGENTKSKHKRGSTVKAVAAGAALAVAAKAATSKRTKLMSKLVPTPSLDGLRDIPDRLRDRLADAGWLNDEEDVEADQPVDKVDELVDEGEEDDIEEDEEPVAEGEEDDVDEEDEEPVDEEDEEPVDEEDEEPVDEAEEDWDDDEDEDEEDFDEDEVDDEEEDEEPPPELEIESEDDEDLHPEDRPPKPPRSKEKAR
jgi:hypothetical protein